MSKELTPLEALEKLVNYILLDEEQGYMDKEEADNVREDKAIVEKELKEYQEIKEIMRNHHCEDRFELNCKLCDYEEMLFDSEENKKKLKVLEIIKRLPLDYIKDLIMFVRSFPEDTFGDFISWGGDETPILINQEEYDLLKEILS